jgi:hypothetical protein
MKLITTIISTLIVLPTAFAAYTPAMKFHKIIPNQKETCAYPGYYSCSHNGKHVVSHVSKAPLANGHVLILEVVAMR